MSLSNLPPVLAGQMKSSDKEVATAQEQMAAIFVAEQERAINGRIAVQDQIEAGQDLQLHVYKNRIPSCHYVFRDGSQATFVNGEFKTANPYEIEQLDKEVRMNHPHIYIDKTVPAVVSAKAEADPMAALRAKIRAEILAESAPQDMGSNRPQDGSALKPSSTADIATAVAGGVAATGQPLPAALRAALRN